MASSRDLASNSIWVDSLERSLARRGRPRRASLELGMLTPARDLSDPDNLADSVLYWRTRRAAGNSTTIPTAGGATALALLAATTIPTLAGGHSDAKGSISRGATHIGTGASTRTHLVARVSGRKAFDASAISGLAAPAPAAQQTSASVTYGTVGQVQNMLGLAADGKIGPLTATAIRHFQASHGLTVNGIVDETTFNAMQAAYTPPAQVVAPTSTTAPTVGGASSEALAHAAMAAAPTVAATAPIVATTDAPASTGGTTTSTDATSGTTTTAIDQTTTPADSTTAAVATAPTSDPTTVTTADTAPAATTTDTTATATTDATVGTQPAVPAGVSALQAALHVQADGTFGSQTKAAVEAFQAAHGLTVDGVVGPTTRAALGLGDGPTLLDTQPPPPPPPAPAATTGAGGASTPAPDAPSTSDASTGTSSSTTTTTSSSSDSSSTTTASSGEPANIATGISEMIGAADQIATLPYIWGGGHGSWVSPGYDCSGSVSYVLHAAGLLSIPEDSGSLMSYGAPGPGKYITIYTSPSHAWMTIDGRRFDTVALSEDGSRWASGGGEFAGFVERHPIGY